MGFGTGIVPEVRQQLQGGTACAACCAVALAAACTAVYVLGACKLAAAVIQRSIMLAAVVLPTASSSPTANRERMSTLIDLPGPQIVSN
jgi:hypothetical protein